VHRQIEEDTMTETIAAAVAILALAALAALMLAASTGLPFRVRHRPALRIEIVIGDITTQHVDVIVNAAKSSLLGGGGVDGAIHRAGGPAILRECRDLRAHHYPDGLPAGQAVVTIAGRLPAEHVIHTVGPMYDPFVDQSAILRSCYTESLARADEVGARTVAFPLISAGVYGWPKDDAVVQALTALMAAHTSVQTARLVVFDAETHRVAQAIANR
jgi:O-acetyl-ADP-ribose deacetylase (regulator of RNase III)